MNLLYTEQAIADLDRAVAWYEKQRKGLGLEFLVSVEKVASNISDSPFLYPVKHRGLRSALVSRFPFTVFYDVNKSQVVIHALFDNRQDPQRLP